MRCALEEFAINNIHSLHTTRTVPIRRHASALCFRYGPPILLATAVAGYLNSSSSSCTFFRPTRLDAPRPSSWFSIGGSQKRNTSTSTKDAEEHINESGSGESTSGEQKPPPQTRRVTNEGDETKVEEQQSAWQTITKKIYEVPQSVGSLPQSVTSLPESVSSLPQSVSSLGDSIVDYVVPSWAKMLPGFVRKLQSELSMDPGSLAEEIWYEANDPETNPEIIWDASVRVSEDLCAEEKRFRDKRHIFTKRGLARYLDIPEDKIHPEDVPIIAMCGSGGGLRALVAGSSSYLSAHEQGLFDCVTYTAGVSGSCWLQTMYYSNIAQRSHARLIRHLKNRLGVHIAFPLDALELVASAPTNKYLLGGLVEKAKGTPDADFGIVDVYGILLAARLLVPKGELSVDAYDFKVSNQRRYTDDGSQPMPIYTAVRHEIPLAEQDSTDQLAAEAQARKDAWFQWFE
jgi:phospholipase A2